MNSLDSIKAYLASLRYEDRGPSHSRPMDQRFPCVTISRQSGAGGHSLANAVLEELSKAKDSLLSGWVSFDAETCKKVLEDAKLQVSLDSLIDEEYRTQMEETIYEFIPGSVSQDKVIPRIFHTIRLLARFGKLIVVGRGGACLTAHLPQAIHIRLVAPLEFRIARTMELHHLDSAGARAIIQKQDEARARLVRDYFGKDINDPLLYHATWNTGRIPVEDIAPLIVQMIKQRAGQPSPSVPV